MTTIKSERGATLVEFVLLLPLLLIFLFAIIEFSVMMYDKAVISLGSREGARAAIVWRPDVDSFMDATEIADEVDNFLGVVDGNPPTRLISFGDKSTALQPYVIEWAVDDPVEASWVATGFDPATHIYVRVTVNYRFNFLVLQALEFMGLPVSINLHGRTIMRMENPS